MGQPLGFNLGFSKSIFQSVTFWGAVLTAIAMAVPALAAKFGLSSANAAVDAQYIVQGIGAVIVVIGRFTAKQVVTLSGGPVSPAKEMPGSKG
jgi:hypothetical protein